MTTLRRGMDHDLYAFSALPERPALVWPNGARLAVTVLLHLEYWELQAPEGSVRDNRFTGEYGFYHPEVPTLHPARVRQPHRHLPHPRAARRVRPEGHGRGQRGCARPVPGVGRGAARPRLRVRRPRRSPDADAVVGHERRAGTRGHRPHHAGVPRRAGQAAAGLAEPRQRREPPHAPARERGGIPLSAGLAERRSALSDDDRAAARLDPEPDGMGRRDGVVAAQGAKRALSRPRGGSGGGVGGRTGDAPSSCRCIRG